MANSLQIDTRSAIFWLVASTNRILIMIVSARSALPQELYRPRRMDIYIGKPQILPFPDKKRECVLQKALPLSFSYN